MRLFFLIRGLTLVSLFVDGNDDVGNIVVRLFLQLLS